ncbi:TetR family transcriptional regulator [Pseudoxanthomonas kalamensis DSM 18571]|uniref:TetR/AcrR family transcriptional regulator n=1 Tax=Pseudoxanthomonas kalamensis TaxID=289483 RepID=UPI001390EAAD|nr:TetR/AcrR family transcriptional regulator [Pseudoxanthomonas kalamensis]KAF1712082.1 TetR family transcriptional regulator [Pseudoxanthomonas kalamensis DSM 18571]
MVSAPKSAAARKPPSRQATGPGRPKDLGKRTAILEAAKQLFIREGFAGASMDQIAAEARVSKLTVYSHFGDKETLFAEAIRCKCEELLPEELFQQSPKGPLREQMLVIARAFFTLVSTDESLAMHRVIINAQHTDTPLREIFWKSGPLRIHEAFSAFLRNRVAAGELAIDDIDRAAKQFFCLVKGELHAQMMCKLCQPPTRAEEKAHLEATVDFFLKAYAPA